MKLQTLLRNGAIGAAALLFASTALATPTSHVGSSASLAVEMASEPQSSAAPGIQVAGLWGDLMFVWDLIWGLQTQQQKFDDCRTEFYNNRTNLPNMTKDQRWAFATLGCLEELEN